tara:strand:+ start:742 stop:4236 length:3495 start_codon:yes stop_codon:yes gene_type:complete
MGSSDSERLRLESEVKKDQATIDREKALWDQSQAYADVDPFSQQYGDPSAMPGMGQMSQAGQKYLTDSILGTGEYEAQNLGFTDYEQPDTLAPPSRQQVDANAAAAAAAAAAAEEERLRLAALAPIIPPKPPGGRKLVEWLKLYGPNANATTPVTPVTPTVPTTPTIPPKPPGGRKLTEWNKLYGSLDLSAEDEGLAFGGYQSRQQPGVLSRADQLGMAAADRGVSMEYTPEMARQESERLQGDARAQMSALGPGDAITGDYTDAIQRQMAGARMARGAAAMGDRSAELAALAGQREIVARGAAAMGDRSAELAALAGQREIGPEIRSVNPARATMAPRPSPIGGAPLDEVRVDRGPPSIDSQERWAEEARGREFPPWTGVTDPSLPEGRKVADLETATEGDRLAAAGPRGLLDTRSVEEYYREVEGRDPYSQTVGVREMEEGAEATRRMLEGGAPVAPTYADITKPSIDWTTVGEPTAIGDIGQAAAPETRFDVGEIGDYGFKPELAGVEDLTVERITGGGIAGPTDVTIDPVTGQVTEAVGAVAPGGIAGPTDVAVAPVYGAETRGVDPVRAEQIGVPIRRVAAIPTQAATAAAVGGVAPAEFGGSSFLGGPAIQDYMNQAGTEAAVTQARQDYEVALNREQARQAQAGAFGARGTVEEAGLIGAQERNIAAIRGAGFERAAGMMESDAARRQQAGMQTQQLGAQTGLAGQALEAGRYESDAAREQQARQATQQLTMQSGLQRQQLAQQALTRQAELGTQAGLQGQQLEAQRRESDAARAQQAALAGQQLGTQAQMQTQQLAQAGGIRGAELGLQAGMQGQQLEAQRREADASRAQQAALAGQQLGTQTGMQTQQLQQQAAMQTAQNALTAAQSNQQAVMQSGTQQQQLEAARQTEEAQLGLSAAQQTQQLGAQSGIQQQQLETQVAMQNAQNEIRIAEQNMQSALQTGDQQSAINAQRQIAQAQMGLDAATRNQAAGLQSAGMGLDAQGQFRGQQMGAAQQLADIGGMTQGATFNAAGQLQQMGAQQEQTQRLQQAWDYEQWLRGQEGGAQALALRQGMMPGGSMQTFGRQPDRFGQILGAATSLGGAAIQASDVRVKDNIKYAGTKNGLNFYEFNYLGSDNRYRGVMAQEVMKERPDAVESRNGIYWVNYGALGIQLEAV